CRPEARESYSRLLGLNGENDEPFGHSGRAASPPGSPAGQARLRHPRSRGGSRRTLGTLHAGPDRRDDPDERPGPHALAAMRLLRTMGRMVESYQAAIAESAPPPPPPPPPPMAVDTGDEIEQRLQARLAAERKARERGQTERRTREKADSDNLARVKAEAER